MFGAGAAIGGTCLGRLLIVEAEEALHLVPKALLGGSLGVLALAPFGAGTAVGAAAGAAAAATGTAGRTAGTGGII